MSEIPSEHERMPGRPLHRPQPKYQHTRLDHMDRLPGFRPAVRKNETRGHRPERKK